MSGTTSKSSVRITLLYTGLSPPIFILASFTDPPWEPHEMKSAAIEPSGVNGDKPTIKKVPHIFWRRFDIGPGVWRYRFRIGLNDRLMHNHRAETETDSSGECYSVLRVEHGGPMFFQSPAPLPGWPPVLAFSQMSPSDSDSWRSTLKNIYSHKPGDSPSSIVTTPFPSSPVSAATTGSATSDNREPDEEQPLLLDQASETDPLGSIRSSSEDSMESEDQNGFFALCWQNIIAWIYAPFARLLGQPSNA